MFEIIKAALESADATLEDVVRTRVLLTRIDDWEVVAKVRGEYFADIRPVDTVMQVTRFINPEWLVEIEVDAVITMVRRDGAERAFEEQSALLPRSLAQSTPTGFGK